MSTSVESLAGRFTKQDLMGLIRRISDGTVLISKCLENTISKILYIKARLPQRDRATAAWVSFGQKWKRIFCTV